MQKKIACPLLVLWGEKGAMHDIYDVMGIWRDRANRVFGKSLPAGHNLQEDVPELVLAEIEGLLKMA
jgi:haloacetate dehalogenase